MPRPAHLLRALVCGLCLMPGTVLAEDVANARDHPLFGRYQGSSIVFYKSSDYDEVALLQAPHDFATLLERDAVHDRSGAEWLTGEGRVTSIRYEVPVGRSSLEVMRNYERALVAKGFQVVFDCSDQACFKGSLRDPYLLGQQIDTQNGDTARYLEHARYMLVKLDSPGGAVYGGVLVGEQAQLVTAFIVVLETKLMEANNIAFVDAGAMQQSIAEGRSVSLYGIQFDHDRDVLRPESKPTLDEIAELLAAQPDLRLQIVGHTDNTGDADYNMDLSRRRAASVVAALISGYGISPDRLTASGAGFLFPVASNDSDEGRAMNRRVELRPLGSAKP